MSRKPKEELEEIDENVEPAKESFEPIDPLEEEKEAFRPPVDTVTSLPLDDNNVLEVLKMVLAPIGIQKLQFTEIEVSWIRDLVINDLQDYAKETVKQKNNPNFDWEAFNERCGYPKYNGRLSPRIVVQYSVAKWQRPKNRRLIKDAHELALSSKEETDDAKLWKRGFQG